MDQQLPVAASSSSSSSSVYPRLLPSYPDTVDSCQQQLCEVLHITPAEAQLLMLNSAEAAALPRQQLEANWGQLQRLLPVSQPQLLQAMLQLPELLLQPQHVVSIRLSEAAEVLQIPLSQLQRQQKVTTPQLHWRLLLLSPHELEERLVQLLQLLDLQEQQQKQQRRQQQQQHEQVEQLSRKLRKAVVGLVVQEPRLLSVDQAQLVSSVEALEQVGCSSMHVQHVHETMQVRCNSMHVLSCKRYAGRLLVAFTAVICSYSTSPGVAVLCCSRWLQQRACNNGRRVRTYKESSCWCLQQLGMQQTARQLLQAEVTAAAAQLAVALRTSHTSH
jgi:hypothetical protein